MAHNAVNVVLCWHMHQPQYRDAGSGRILQPWTYLHAVKDYADMAAHLERYPDARAVVNFAPVLLEEILGYCARIESHLETGGRLEDPLLAALAAGSADLSSDQRRALGRDCLRANRQRMVQRFRPFHELVEVLEFHHGRDAASAYLDPSFYDDLVVWYHLAWLGETVRRDDLGVQRLLKKGRGYTRADRQALLRVLLEVLKGLIPRYRSLSASGQIELSMSPYAHPMLPLLIDFGVAREAMPHAILPEGPYPGGAARARWHIEAGLRTFREVFGETPAGCWPSEGGVSDAVLPLLAEQGFRWVASGQGVLKNSLRRCGTDPHDAAWPYRAYTAGPLRAFFRDDALSDAIAFEYSDWHGEDAVADLVGRIEGIAGRAGDSAAPVVSIIMDGENAWEHYPENGYYFLDHLYDALTSHPGIRLTTYRDLLPEEQAAPLPSLCAGSWVYGTFSTWIGDPDKNRAWEILVDSKRTFDRALAASRFSETQTHDLERQLAMCEGSDWFWWFGDVNPARAVEEFSTLFGTHVRTLHDMLGCPAPAGLDAPFGRGGDAESGGAMRRGSG